MKEIYCAEYSFADEHKQVFFTTYQLAKQFADNQEENWWHVETYLLHDSLAPLFQ